jgi:hypothetical protein
MNINILQLDVQMCDLDNANHTKQSNREEDSTSSQSSMRNQPGYIANPFFSNSWRACSKLSSAVW